MDNGELEELAIMRDCYLRELINACIKYGIGKGLEKYKELMQRREGYGHLG